MYQAKSAVVSFWEGEGGGAGLKIKITQNGLKYILVFEFLKSDECF